MMDKNTIVAMLMMVLLISGAPVFAAPLKSVGTTDVYFSPRGGATEAVVREIDGAKREIRVLAYSFTSVPIAKSLLQANKRGVKIEAVLDKTNRKKKAGSNGKSYSAATFLDNAGIPVFIDDAHSIQHNKVVIVDGETLITGSFNFSKAAEQNNAENLLVIKGNKALVERYIEDYRKHKGHAESYGN